MTRVFDVRDFGAVANSTIVNTQSIQSAINAAANAGGGTVHFPPGSYVSGTLQLRSHITIRLENGAILKASGSMGDYAANPFHHNEWGNVFSLLWAIDEDSIVIEGDGCIDLNDEPFMDWDTLKTGETFRHDLLGRLNERQQNEATVTAKEARPNQCLFFQNVRSLSIRNITVRRAPCWALSIHSSSDVKIHGISILNHRRVPNSDGIHICSSRNVLISNCNIESGDDCIAITGITNWELPSDSIIISDCVLISSSAAIRIGHLASKILRVTVRNIIIRDSLRGIALFAGDGGWIKDVSVSGAFIQTRLICGHWWGNGEPVVLSAAEGSGTISHVVFRDISSQSENGILIIGCANNIDNVDFQYCRLEIASGLNRPLLGHHIDLQPAALRKAPAAEHSIPWLILRETGAVRFRHLQPTRAAEEAFFEIAADLDDSPVSFVY